MNLRGLISRVVILLSGLVLAWILVANIITSKKAGELILFAIVALFVAGIVRYRQIIYRWASHNPKKLKFILLTLILLSLGVRLCFSFLHYQPYSDPATFFETAKSLSFQSTPHNAFYIALFPYTFSYDLILHAGFTLLGANVFTVIIMGCIFDMASAWIIYLILKKSTLGLVGATIWMINPFNILFSTLSLPISIVSTLLFLSIYVALLLVNSLKYKNMKKIIYLSLATGVIFSLTNSFRPLLVIFIIALILYSFITPIKKSDIGRTCASFLIVVVVFLCMNSLILYGISQYTKYPAGSDSGWSVYVGTNLESGGEWNTGDVAVRTQLQQQGISPVDIHQKLKEMAYKRVSKYSPSELIDLIYKKSVVLGGEQRYSLFNLASYPAVKNHLYLRQFVVYLCGASILLLVFGTLLALYTQWRQSRMNILLLFNLLIVGLFFASLLVEVSDRYFMPFLPILYVYLLLSCRQFISKELKLIS